MFAQRFQRRHMSYIHHHSCTIMLRDLDNQMASIFPPMECNGMQWNAMFECNPSYTAHVWPNGPSWLQKHDPDPRTHQPGGQDQQGGGKVHGSPAGICHAMPCLLLNSVFWKAFCFQLTCPKNSLNSPEEAAEDPSHSFTIFTLDKAQSFCQDLTLLSIYMAPAILLQPCSTCTVFIM